MTSQVMQGVMALHRQAHRMVQEFKSDLARRGLGLSAEDEAAVAASHAANPSPKGYGTAPTAEQQAQVEATQQAAMNAVYPPEGIAESDPRLAPIEGVDLVTYSAVAQALGWSDDPELKERLCKAFGVDARGYDASGEEWGQRLRNDIVLATLYGQLFAAHAGAPEISF